MNKIKDDLEYSEPLEYCNITSIHKKVKQSVFDTYQGVFRNILDILIYNDVYPDIDRNLIDAKKNFCSLCAGNTTCLLLECENKNEDDQLHLLTCCALQAQLSQPELVKLSEIIYNDIYGPIEKQREAEEVLIRLLGTFFRRAVYQWTQALNPG